MSKPALRNLVEDHAEESYRHVVGSFTSFCGCDTCHADVLVYALNRLPPRYVVGLEGRVVSDINLEKDQNRAAIDVAVMEGIRKVALAPRCGRKA
ncbi:MAG: late competence development ComFB family protein [Gemmatimonadetes bacterium]|nr:late competence development ComFB family protein [Gemmatimonadota bacterium]